MGSDMFLSPPPEPEPEWRIVRSGDQTAAYCRSAGETTWRRAHAVLDPDEDVLRALVATIPGGNDVVIRDDYILERYADRDGHLMSRLPGEVLEEKVSARAELRRLQEELQIAETEERAARRRVVQLNTMIDRVKRDLG